MIDKFTRHVGTLTVATISVLAALGMLWQVIHQHEVDPLLAGTLTLTIGLLIPSPLSTQRVTVENTPEDPVPVDAGYGLVELLIAFILLLLAIWLVVALVGR